LELLDYGVPGIDLSFRVDEFAGSIFIGADEAREDLGDLDGCLSDAYD